MKRYIYNMPNTYTSFNGDQELKNKLISSIIEDTKDGKYYKDYIEPACSVCLGDSYLLKTVEQLAQSVTGSEKTLSEILSVPQQFLELVSEVFTELKWTTPERYEFVIEFLNALPVGANLENVTKNIIQHKRTVCLEFCKEYVSEYIKTIIDKILANETVDTETLTRLYRKAEKLYYQASETLSWAEREHESLNISADDQSRELYENKYVTNRGRNKGEYRMRTYESALDESMAKLNKLEKKENTAKINSLGLQAALWPEINLYLSLEIANIIRADKYILINNVKNYLLNSLKDIK